MPSEVAAGEVLATVPEGRLTLGRASEIQKGCGAPPTEQESAEYEAQRKRLAPLFQEVTRQFEALEASGALQASRQIQDHWDELTPRQQRRFGDAKIRDAPLLLRMLPQRAPIVRIAQRPGSETRPREQRARRRATAPSRGDPSPDDDPSDGPAPVILLSGFQAASERLSRHLQRRTAARRFA